MTTPTGQISLNDVNVELGKSGTTTIALGNSDVRSLAGVASGAISMNNLRGKSSVVNLSYTFSANTANASLNLSALSGYSAGKSNITVTINSGVYLYATSTSSYGLNITGGTTGDTLTIVNNGYIMGQGGQGGSSITAPSGGPALNLGFGMSSCTINNTNGSAYIGGGGGGGGSSSAASGSYGSGGGGGAGGGPGGNGVVGGTIGGVGGNSSDGGGGGGRIFPGSGGAAGGLGGGAGGGGGKNWKSGYSSQPGAGGSSNNAGGNGTRSNFASGASGGGGWGASGGSTPSGGVGGAGGKAINTNGKSITWTSGVTARVWGSVS